MLGQSLKNLCESNGVRKTALWLAESLNKKKFKPEDFSIKELAEAFCGHDWVRRLHPANIGRFADVPILEAGEGVDVSAFSNITGQLVFTKIHQGWNQVAQLADKLFETVKTPFDGEKIPGIGRIKGDGYSIAPGQDYPELGFGEQYWTTPSTDKEGFIVSIDKETIFFDRTGLVLRRGSEAGRRLSYRKERKCLACFAGVTVTFGNESFNGNNHVWNGTSYNTYDTSANAIGINSLASQELVDWTDIEALWLLFQNLRDPDTSLPIDILPETLVVMPAKAATALRIQRATSVRSGDITSGAGHQTISDNPINAEGYETSGGMMIRQVFSSALLYQIIVDSGVSAANAAHWHFYGEPKRAFHYMENWPLTTFQAPPNSEAEFTRDIVARYKASERGIPFSADPRYITKGYNS